MVSVFAHGEKLFEKTGFTIATVIAFNIRVYLCLVKVGLDNNLNSPLLSLQLASDFFVTDFKNQTEVCIAFRLTVKPQIEVWQNSFFDYAFQLVPLFVVHLCREYLKALQSDSI